MFWRISLVELTSLSVFCSVTWKKNDDWMTNCRIFFRPGSFHVWQSWSRSYLSHFALSLFSSLLVCCNQEDRTILQIRPWDMKPVWSLGVDRFTDEGEGGRTVELPNDVKWRLWIEKLQLIKVNLKHLATCSPKVTSCLLVTCTWRVMESRSVEQLKHCL